MRRTVVKWFVYLLLLFMPALFAQDFDHRFKPYSWKNHHSPEVEVDSLWADYDAVIVDAELIFDRKAQYVRAFYRIKFLTDAGVQRYNRFWIPMKANPLAQRDSRAGLYRPKFHSGAIYLLDARQLYPDSVRRPLLYERIERETFSENSGNVHLQAHEIRVRELRPGDEVEIIFSHFIRWPTLWLLEHELPVQQLNVGIVPDGAKLSFPLNRLESADTVQGKLWLTYANLPPLELPSFNHPPDSLHWLHWQPFGAEAANYGLLGWIRRRPSRPGAYFQPPIDALTRKINSFAESARKSSSAIEAAQIVQRAVLSGLQFFTGSEQNVKGTFRYFLFRDSLAERYQNRFYAELLDRLPFAQYMAWIESRHAGGDKAIYPSGFGLQWQGFALSDKEDTVLLLPRSHSFGMQANEFPFYLAGAQVWLAPRSLEDGDVPGVGSKGSVSRWRLPELADTGHVRALRLSYRRNSGTKGWTLSGSVALTGQWSTMNRGAWTKGWADSLADPVYGKLPSPDFPFVAGELKFPELQWAGSFSGVELNTATVEWLLLSLPQIKQHPYGYRPDFPFSEKLQIDFVDLPSEILRELLAINWKTGDSAVSELTWRVEPGTNYIRLNLDYSEMLSHVNPQQFKVWLETRSRRNLVLREFFRIAEKI